MGERRLSKADRLHRAEIIAREFGGIFAPAEAFYLHSVIYSARRGLRAFEEYEANRANCADAEYLVSVLQEAVGHAAALSRYFWPSLFRMKAHDPAEMLKKARGDKLRQAFELSEQSPLHDRKLRNAWEHFDERLDVFLLENDKGAFFPDCILGDHRIADDPLGHIFKLLDPDAECLVLLGEKFFFGPLRAEVGRVLDLAAAYDSQGGRLPRLPR